MKVMLYDRLDPASIPNFEKTKRALEAGDFRSADVKKIGHNLYRARLDIRDRLLFSLYRHQDQTFVLVLEHIANHAYDRSRFLRRVAAVDESKLPALDSVDGVDTEPLSYLNPHLPTFQVLNKVISFDDAQQEVFTTPPPFVVIGSAGSGKTALTLEKVKRATGDVLYVTRSPYLVRNSRDVYYSLGYQNDDQDVSFLSFTEYLSSLRVPAGRELQFRDFARWFTGHRVASKLDDANQVFEEFQGVLTVSTGDTAYLSLDEYLALGVKQSIFLPEGRERVYRLFLKYLDFMRDHDLYDANLLSHEYLPLVEPRYDFIVVDEVQDMTTVQLDIILRSLTEPGNFILCGDANQIVHPNFFSWSKLKSFFYGDGSRASPAGWIRILNSNYRNSLQVTELANRILKLKTARFGSIDRESHYLVRSTTDRPGIVLLLHDDVEVTGELNRKTRLSTRFAVIVLDPNQKSEAKKRFDTPLIFSVQEAKGLEYDSIILYDFASAAEDRFREISRGVEREDVLASELRYGRTKDKTDRSLEIYKFHINALYVAITRAVDNVYLIETEPAQRLFDLLGLAPSRGPLELAEQDSSLETWRQEARRLELQGKEEQAEQIRSQILKLQSVPWPILQGDALAEIERQALDADDKRAKLLLFEYALVYQDGNLLNALARKGFKPALRPEKGIKLLNQKYFFPYDVRNPDQMLREVDRFGVDFRNVFNQTPLMIAARFGGAHHVQRLVEMGADTGPRNNAGLSAFQIALEQACSNPEYAASKLAGVYECLEPPEMVIQAGGRLHKLDNRSMEFLMLNLMIAMFYTHLGDRITRVGGAFTSADFVDALSHFPAGLVPERRKARAYVSSILAKNEVDRDDRYNRKLFFRVKHGHYVVNPKLAVRVGEEWRAIYDLLSLDALGYRRREPDDAFARYSEDYALLNLQRFKALIERALAEAPAAEAPADRGRAGPETRVAVIQDGLFGAAEEEVR
ncbi:ankyrin repeat domain-containing protein [soil metagenome]